ncbi:MAG: cell division protease FtsH, partial [Actinomycetota bacterium]|nr:cell division protease FtsH [Actinomycetota bacterium]
MTSSLERGPGFSVHHSSPAKSGPPNDPPKPAVGRKPAPRWTHSLWIVGLIFTLLLLFAPSAKPSTTSLLYSDWKSKIIANQVDTAVIDQSGKVTGQLLDKNKTHYQSRIPTVLTDNSLAGDLIAHHVKTSGTASSTSLLSVLLGLLPLLLLVGVFFFISRRASRQIAGGIGGIGASKAKVYDQQRPKTRFSDVAGYDGAKRESSEVVDFLKHAARYARVGAVIP